jgi:hypothetical protein
MKTGAGAGGLGGSRRRGGWGISPRRRARALSAQTRGPYSVRPWSCCWAQHPCWSQAAGERYPTHLADAHPYAEFAGHEEWLFQATFVNCDRRSVSLRVSVSLGVEKSFGGRQHKRSLRRRMVGHISIRQLGSDREVGPSSSSRDGRNMVHALSVDKARARCRRDPSPSSRRMPRSTPLQVRGGINPNLPL